MLNTYNTPECKETPHLGCSRECGLQSLRCDKKLLSDSLARLSSMMLRIHTIMIDDDFIDNDMRGSGYDASIGRSQAVGGEGRPSERA